MTDAPHPQTSQPDTGDDAPVKVLSAPAHGVPPIVDTPDALGEVVRRFATATGPVAVDAERASGFRYGQKTYLAQFKREGAGIALIDTDALPDLSALSDALRDAEWILHAASQDLPGLRELGMEPARVFDTELGARLLGWPKVGLAAVVERELGLTLAKEHSAQDWSERPLPDAWLNYAALDVEVLIELHAAMVGHLEEAGKLEWARQEFEAVRLAPPPAPKVDPWRRIAGKGRIRDPRGLGIIKSMWEAREEQGQDRDISPGRVLRDQAIIAAAIAKPTSFDELMKVREFQSRGTKRRAPQWYKAIERAMQLPESELPPRRGPASDGPPEPRSWQDKRPDAFARLSAAKATVSALADKHDLPQENLIQPDAVRRLCWDYPDPSPEGVRAYLEGRGARPWQVNIVSAPLAEALAAAEVPEEAPADES